MDFRFTDSQTPGMQEDREFLFGEFGEYGFTHSNSTTLGDRSGDTDDVLNLTSIITTHTHKLRLTFNDHCLSDHTNHHILYYLPYDAYFSSHLLRTVYLTYSSMAYIYQNVFDVDYVLFFH